MRKIQPGILNTRVEVQEPAEVPNSFGEPGLEWRTIATVWASVEPLSGRELWQAAQVRPDVTHRVLMRPTAVSLTSRLRLLVGGSILNLMPPAYPSRAQGYMEVMATEEV